MILIYEYFWILSLILVTTARKIPEGLPLLTVNQEQQQNIAMNLDQSISPCDDFYTYACGSYTEQNRNMNYQEMTSLLDYQYNLQLLNLMDTFYQHKQPVELDEKQSFTEKTRIYLRSCRIQQKREIRKYFEEFKPGTQLNWPIWDQQSWLSDDINNLFDVWNLLGRMQAYGLNNVLVNQEILISRNGSYTIMLEPAYTEENTTLPDLMVIQIFLKNLGIKKSKKILKNLEKINQNITKILEQYEEENNETLELKYKNVDKQFPQLHLKEFLKELLQQELAEDTLIVIRRPQYFQFLNDEMWQLFQKQDLCNYLMMKFLFYLAADSATEFTALGCIKDLRNKMDVAVNYLFYKHFIKKEITKITQDMANIQNNILKEFSYIFQQNHLQLRPKQINFLLEKLMAITVNIGNLPKNSNHNELEKYYETLPTLDGNNYFKNHLYLLKHRFQKSLLYAGDQTHFIVPDNKLGSSAGALYIIKQNMIILPFASLQMPFYHIAYDDLKKYSLLAFILAHEYTHAFDTTGLLFDKYGSLSLELSNIVEQPLFQSSVECLQNQLATSSIDERLADIVASRVVYNILNIRQLSAQYLWQKDFYLNMAQFFCGKTNLKFVDHDTDAERLNQIVINSPGFANAFQCPVDSKMNPSLKCRVY